MIKYALKCADGHSFESWFQSADAFESLCAAGHVSCPTCGVTRIEKALMAPKLAPSRERTTDRSEVDHAAQQTDMSDAIKRIKAEVEARSDYVGDQFVHEARAIHLDEAPARPIHGEARPEEAKALVEEGVPILPLPFRPTRKSN